MDKAGSSDLRERIARVAQRIPGGALLFAVALMIVLGYFGWYYYGADHLDRALYSLQLEKLSVTPQPAWIKSQVAQEVYQNGRLDRISLLEPRANAAVAQAFETHNWVKSTTRVSKAMGGHVQVDVVYRRPMAMVFYEKRESDLAPNEVSKGFFPIDDEGTVLPTNDFSREDTWKYFMIFAQDARPAGDVGMPYGDVRITEALRLCALLESYREPLGLQEIWVSHDQLASGPSPWSLSIVTLDKTREVIWGHAPQAESRGELPAEEKLQRMVDWFKQPLGVGPDAQRLDLRFTSNTLPVSHR